jgi:hypothetical protein
MGDIKASNFGGIPFGNTANRPTAEIGKLYSNGETARLELYTSAGAWENIVQEVPGVSGVSGTYSESSNSGTITITGTNFVSGAIASATGTNGVEVQAASTTYNSLVQLTAVFTGLSNANEPYDIKVTNPSNLFGILPDALYVNATPAWNTVAGSLGTFVTAASVSASVSATDPEGTSVSYSSSNLPGWLSLNSSTGTLTGTAPVVTQPTTYSFSITASDGVNSLARSFSVLVNDQSPVWVTSATLSTFTKNVPYSVQLSATDDSGGSLTYSVVSGSLPTGLNLSSSGLISGTPTSSSTASVTIRATDQNNNFTNRAFTLPNTGPTWTTSGTISSMGNGSAYSYQLVATDDSGSAPSYSLVSGTFPTGITLSSSGLISGTASGITGSTGTLSFVFSATDSNGVSVNSSTISIPTFIYAFSNHTFTTASATGNVGPTLNAVRSAYSSTTWAATYLNMTSQGIQEWTVPSTGNYTITAAGAKGGIGASNYDSGYGATMSGTFSLVAGAVLRIAVGQTGGQGLNGNGGGGGGGTFVATSANSPLICAGGGGGSSYATANNITTQNHGSSSIGNGNAGVNQGSEDNAGAGFNTNVAGTSSSAGAFSFLNGANGGNATLSNPVGGFGGGGAGYQSFPSGGGGGGYQGGNSGTSSWTAEGNGQGGLSYNVGTSQSNSSGSNNGNGYVTITKL